MAWTMTKKRQQKTIKDGDKFITIQKMTQGDRDDILDILIKMDSSMMDKKSKKEIEAQREKLKKGDTSGVQMQLGKMKHLQRVRSIVEWNLTYEEDGSPVPLNEESIKALPSEIVSEIDAAIEELNPEIDEPKKNE